MNTKPRGRKRLGRSRDFHVWKVRGGGGGLKRLTYDGVMYFYFRYPLGTMACGEFLHMKKFNIIRMLLKRKGVALSENILIRNIGH